MRLRKKKHLEEKVERVSANLIGRDCYGFYKLEDKTEYMLDLKKVFNNDNPVEVEIGCGKGDFLLKKAQENPNINYIGVELLINVLVDALNLVGDLKNLKFINCDAQNLKWFLPKDSVSKIYLNFSCPFPKKQYANRRLTNQKFLEIYKNFCVPNFTIEQKTDDDNFFEFSLQEYEKSGLKIVEITRDLHNESGFLEQRANLTQYEKKFVSLGKNINFVKVKEG